MDDIGTGMYGRSQYSGYGSYWGGYGGPPPPPPPIPPLEPPPPPPPQYSPLRPSPHSLGPPPPPPPIHPPRPQQSQPPYHQARQNLPQDPNASEKDYVRSQRQSNGGFPNNKPPPPPPQTEDKNKDVSFSVKQENPYQKTKEPMTGSPLVPRTKEPDPPPPSTTSTKIPNNKRPLPVELDPNLPQELISKFFNNSCELCNVKLNSRIQAKNHYEGKQHTKKVKNYLIENARKEGAPPAKAAKIDLSTSKKKVAPLDVSQLYCKCCELSFTSEQHAQQHFLGRNHQRVLHGLKPLRAGYYNRETGKWQRMPPDPRVVAERLEAAMALCSDGEEIGDSTSLLDPDNVKDKGRFFCELCKVSATSQDQLDGHISGQRHQKATRSTQRSSSSTPTPPAVPIGPSDSILASVIKADEVKKNKAKDLSIYRTPSGKYYCSPCDLTLNSESQFAQHVDSKKHKTRRIK